mmetsp:Transcript_3153/g.6669  ORF Transcript_3153/g.6669 Transcript_3153/m.6669 type:complete len:276 (+) Transcript_3153:54-881(+)
MLVLLLLAAAVAESPPPSPPGPKRPAVHDRSLPTPSIRRPSDVDDEQPPLPKDGARASPFAQLLAPLRNAFAPLTAAAAGDGESLRLGATQGESPADGEASEEAVEAPRMDWVKMVGIVLLQLLIRLLPVLLRRRSAGHAAAEAVGEAALGEAAEGAAQASGEAAAVLTASPTAGYPAVVLWLMEAKTKFSAWVRSAQAAPVMLSLLILSTKLVQRFDKSLQQEEAVADTAGEEVEQTDDASEPEVIEVDSSAEVEEGDDPENDGAEGDSEVAGG